MNEMQSFCNPIFLFRCLHQITAILAKFPTECIGIMPTFTSIRIFKQGRDIIAQNHSTYFVLKISFSRFRHVIMGLIETNQTIQNKLDLWQSLYLIFMRYTLSGTADQVLINRQIQKYNARSKAKRQRCIFLILVEHLFRHSDLCRLVKCKTIKYAMEGAACIYGLGKLRKIIHGIYFPEFHIFSCKGLTESFFGIDHIEVSDDYISIQSLE